MTVPCQPLQARHHSECVQPRTGRSIVAFDTPARCSGCLDQFREFLWLQTVATRDDPLTERAVRRSRAPAGSKDLTIGSVLRTPRCQILTGSSGYLRSTRNHHRIWASVPSVNGDCDSTT